jgi:hypothetical protein
MSARSTSEPRPFSSRAAEYGCTQLIPLDERLSEPRQLEYLDLLPARSNQRRSLTAVAEHQGTALLYLVDACGDTQIDAESLASTSRRLANRSDPAWLGVVRSGSLDIFPIGFHESTDTQPVRTIEARSTTAPLFFQSLVHGAFEEKSRLPGTDYVFRKIFDLLTRTTNEFVPPDGTGKIDALAVLSMAGRALFFRFLIDRRIVLEDELAGQDGICPSATELKDVFSTAEKAAQTSAWLDATFNGDFLPLIDESIPNDDRDAREAAYLDFFEKTAKRVGRSIFSHLHAILRGWRSVGSAFQMEIDWGDLDFAHIPVGVLSQVYESFSHRADPRTAADTSVHYTPRTIAKLMVDEAFAAVENAPEVKVLDSACGAGIFLVLAFRRLVRERWQGSERPKTKAIQEVLYNQIRGFDISESALRLAALSLYITAIELNATQRPPQALKFPGNLRNVVLHRFGADEKGSDADVVPLGSLGSEVPTDFDGKFDIVIGNPPWTRLRDRRDDDVATNDEDRKAAIKLRNDQFTQIARRVIKRRNVDLPRPYENPDNNPDLPFFWRATEWCRAGGVIALAMPARLFGRTSGIGFDAWRAVLRSVDVTGLINGADLRWSAVWKDVKMPFCLFFARNAKPKDGHRFQFASPINEPDLNSEGRFRIDYESAQPVSVARVEQQPWLLKTLSFGTWLDVELMEAIADPNNETLKSRWREWDANGDRTGKGFDRSPGLKQKPVDFLACLHVFEKPKAGFEIDFDSLKTYGELFGRNSEGHSSAHMPRRKALYEPPVVIIPQSPGKKGWTARAYLSDRPIAFSQSYYGYSCAGHSDAITLASLLYLLPHSTLFAYFCLMTSRRSGFDRHTFNKEEFDALPFPEIATVPQAKKESIRRLARRLAADTPKPWREINELIFGLYELNPDDVQVAEDTLFFAASYRISGQAAFQQTTHDTRLDFVSSLSEFLEPYFDVCGDHVAVREAEFQSESWNEPWIFLSISRVSENVKINPSLMRKAMAAANSRGCSRIIVNTRNRSGLLLGLLNQRRWWTATRARLCAQHIIRERLGAFGLPENV